MNLVTDLAAIRNPMPTPESVTPADLYPDICAAIEDHRTTDAHHLEAASDGLDTDPLYLALEEARARKAAADAEIRRLLAYGREFHGTRPYRLESLAEASGMTPSGIRTAYGEEELRQVAHEIHREPNGKNATPRPNSRQHD
ncbi:hypothetical protein CIB93_36970 [Streptomyces sp. WZ.A104]|uniref:hypothetical protein n=1 Tax=Streptomyces sp. WZ.A104 TaxID=2023771 RepID=UPI000BBC6606|nr:hypothetical protein [Streptomyces sp. WZ.A104]PCG81150.1 hypothetical protein CIB93_36970 [Streptomyces sp. WZ.A104]